MRKRMIVFIGAMIIDFIILRLFGFTVREGLTIIIVSNIIVAQFAYLVYSKKIFNG